MARPTPARNREINRELRALEARAASLSHNLVGGEGLEDYIRRVTPRKPPPRHVRPLIRLIERSRVEPVQALVSMPPRNAKTVTIINGLTWLMMRNPADTHAYATYGADLSKSKSRIARGLARNVGVRLAEDSQSLAEWRTNEGGGLLATGVGGALTGQGVDGLLVVDDAYKNRKDADSPIYRKMVDEWLREVALTRLEHGSVIVMGTRWHPSDLIGTLLAEGGWEYINLAALAEPGDVLGRQPGEALWPERYDVPFLERRRKALGEWSFAALYQGHPRPRGHRIFGDPTYYDPATFSLDGYRIYIGADPAASDKTTADHTAAVALALRGFGDDMEGVVLDVLRGQWQIPDAVEHLHAFQTKWHGAPLGVEAVAGFKAVPQLLARIDAQLRVDALPASGDKFQRSQPVAAAWNAGRLRVPTSAPWLKAYLHELHMFTGVGDDEDDQADATAHAWNQAAAGTDGLETFMNMSKMGSLFT